MALSIEVAPHVRSPDADADANAGATVVRLAGVLDALSAPQAQAAIARVAATGPRVVVLDLAGLEFVDSSGISVVLLARMHLEKVGAKLVLSNMRRPVRRVFDVVRALPGVPIFDSMADLDAYLAGLQREP